MKTSNKVTKIVRLGVFLVLGWFIHSTNCWASPDWVRHTPYGRDHIYCIGIGESTTSLVEARKASIANAVTGFNAKQGAEVSTKSILKKIEDSAGYRESFIDEIEVKGTSTTLTGLQVVEVYVDRDESPFRVFALLSLPSENQHSPLSPIWRSMVCPGWGQYYSGKPYRGALMMISEAVAIGSAIVTANEYSNLKTKANKTVDLVKRKDYNKQADQFYQTNTIAVVAATVVYALNIADVMLLSHNKSDIYYSARMEPSYHSKDPQVTIGITFPIHF